MKQTVPTVKRGFSHVLEELKTGMKSRESDKTCQWLIGINIARSNQFKPFEKELLTVFCLLFYLTGSNIKSNR